MSQKESVSILRDDLRKIQAELESREKGEEKGFYENVERALNKILSNPAATPAEISTALNAYSNLMTIKDREQQETRGGVAVYFVDADKLPD